MFLDKEIPKTMFLPSGSSWLFFILPGWWIGNEQLFKVGLKDNYSAIIFKNPCLGPYA